MRSWKSAIRTSLISPGCHEDRAGCRASQPGACLVNMGLIRHCLVYSGTVIRHLLCSPGQLVATNAPAGLLALLAFLPPGAAFGQPSALVGSTPPGHNFSSKAAAGAATAIGPPWRSRPAWGAGTAPDQWSPGRGTRCLGCAFSGPLGWARRARPCPNATGPDATGLDATGSW
jgi:hypothetical protein